MTGRAHRLTFSSNCSNASLEPRYRKGMAVQNILQIKTFKRGGTREVTRRVTETGRSRPLKRQ